LGDHQTFEEILILLDLVVEGQAEDDEHSEDECELAHELQEEDLTWASRDEVLWL